MPLRDATDYQFATPARRLLVRQSTVSPDVDLADVARRHADQLVSLLNATDVRTSPPAPTAHGATAVTVTATLPPDEAAADRTPRAVRTAFLRFPDGLLVELTLHAPQADAAADAEFRRLLDSVRPAAAPLEGVARSLAAGPVGGPGHPAGAVRLDLTPDYHASANFLVASADGAESYRLERAVADEAGTRAAAVGTLLGAGVGVARSEDGRPVRYEAGVRPRLSPGRRAAPAAAALEALRGTGEAAPATGAGEAVVDGSVRGTPVRVRVTARDQGPSPRELGERLLRELNEAR